MANHSYRRMFIISFYGPNLVIPSLKLLGFLTCLDTKRGCEWCLWSSLSPAESVDVWCLHIAHRGSFSYPEQLWPWQYWGLSQFHFNTNWKSSLCDASIGTLPCVCHWHLLTCPCSVCLWTSSWQQKEPQGKGHIQIAWEADTRTKALQTLSFIEVSVLWISPLYTDN